MAEKKRTFHAGVKLWIATASGAGVFGEGRYRLLSLVNTHGSLKKAAEKIGMSYRKAWGDIKKSESRAGRKLLIREYGGKGGGGSRLTPFARDLLGAYESLKKDVTIYIDKQFSKSMGSFFK